MRHNKCGPKPKAAVGASPATHSSSRPARSTLPVAVKAKKKARGPVGTRSGVKRNTRQPHRYRFFSCLQFLPVSHVTDPVLCGGQQQRRRVL